MIHLGKGEQGRAYMTKGPVFHAGPFAYSNPIASPGVKRSGPGDCNTEKGPNRYPCARLGPFVSSRPALLGKGIATTAKTRSANPRGKITLINIEGRGDSFGAGPERLDDPP